MKDLYKENYKTLLKEYETLIKEYTKNWNTSSAHGLGNLPLSK